MYLSRNIYCILLVEVSTGCNAHAGQETSFIHAPSHNAELLGRQFATLSKAGAHGVMLDVW